MIEFSDNSKFYVQFNSWHTENEIAIIRKKDKYMDAILLNKTATALWQIAARRAEWTYSDFLAAVQDEIEPLNPAAEARVNDFLAKMIAEGLINRHKKSIFQDEINAG